MGVARREPVLAPDVAGNRRRQAVARGVEQVDHGSASGHIAVRIDRVGHGVLDIAELELRGLGDDAVAVDAVLGDLRLARRRHHEIGAGQVEVLPGVGRGRRRRGEAEAHHHCEERCDFHEADLGPPNKRDR